MLYVHVDESGDMGFSKSSSRYFILTLLVNDDDTIFDRIIKKTRQKKLKKKFKKKHELKASKVSDDATEYLLKRLSGEDVKIFAIIV
ncbi:MAG: DUF3800 domain-containing protein, partial [Candidatus Aenigmatarchaeota archaeon]